MPRTRYIETPLGTFRVRAVHRGGRGRVTIEQVSGTPLTAEQWQRIQDDAVIQCFLDGVYLTRVEVTRRRRGES